MSERVWLGGGVKRISGLLGTFPRLKVGDSYERHSENVVWGCTRVREDINLGNVVMDGRHVYTYRKDLMVRITEGAE